MSDSAKTRHCSASVAPTEPETPRSKYAPTPANRASIIQTVTQTPKRCAVYCRVSSDERLGQEFNSIDAQREAGHAFIASQRAEGWVAVQDSYEDPGYSGGNAKRPALQRLLADIDAGKVDIVVVYKIDRLTRNLHDFAQMVDLFDRRGVSFSAVTQQINSATSMGRLMLNVLLSFAQFEREVTGERIRDKIAASKRKGFWMGGVPPFGYDVVDRKLMVNDAEAAIVRRIFWQMATMGSTTELAADLACEGVVQKTWTTRAGQVRGGMPIDKKFLYKLLRNRIYLGEIAHKGAWYPGVHEAIIDSDLWDKVAAVLTVDGHARAAHTKTRSLTDVLLRGLLYGLDRKLMVPTYTQKKDCRYDYYVSRSESRLGMPGNHCDRIAVADIEAAVVKQVCVILARPEYVSAVAAGVHRLGARIGQTVIEAAMQKRQALWVQLLPVEQHRIIRLMIERIDLVQESNQQGFKIRFWPLGLVQGHPGSTLAH